MTPNSSALNRAVLQNVACALLLVCSIAPAFAADQATKSAISPVRLRCEDLADPQGIDRAAPRLSWVLQSDERGAAQTSYQILVASRPGLLGEGRGDLWDSGKVVSDESVLVPYKGTALFSGEDCWWQVRAWDSTGRPSPWSAPAHWSMGLLHPDDWTGQWIGLDEVAVPVPFTGAQWIWTDAVPPAPQIDPLTRYFRTEVDLPSDCAVRSGHLLIASSGEFVANVNGVRILQDFAASTARDVDVTWRLKPGRNVVAISLQPEHSPALPPGIVARIEVDLMDGRRMAFSTDGRWKASAFPRVGWESPGYDDSDWSAARALVEAGDAPWGPLLRPASRRLPARWLRREFSADRPVLRATVYYSGLGVSELYLNGARVGDEVLSPGLSEIPERAFYLTRDVTLMVRAGRNAIGAVLGNGRYYAPRRGAPFGDVYPKLMLKLVIEYRDGGREVVVSDRNWRLTDRGPIRANSEYDGEEYDARMELKGWSEPGFDDSGWVAAREVAPAASVLSAQMFPPIRVTDTLAPVSVRQTAPGVYVFDMGQNMVGRCRLRVRGAAGTTVTLRHAETVAPDGSPRFENLRTAMATDAYTLKGGEEETYEPRFTSHGFRYVEVRGYPGTPPSDAVQGHVVHDDLERIGSWTSSSELLNRIYGNMTWGIQGNYRSIPTDCPQRDERQGWLGDRVFESKGESFVFDTSPLYRKWFQDMADAQRPDGSISDVCPSYWPLFNQDVTWPGCFIMATKGLYEQSGDPEFFTRHYDAMKKWVTHMEGFLAGGVMPNDRYGDWCPPPENRTLIHAQDPRVNTSGAFLATAHFYSILRLMETYAERSGRDGDSKAYAALADRIRAAFNPRFLAPGANHYDTGSQASYLLPLAFGLVPEENRRAIEEGLANRVATSDRYHVATGLIGIQHLMQTLTAIGRTDLALRVALQDTYPSWGYMVGRGATTIWELWDGDTAEASMNSGNHVMLIGDCVTWLYEDLAGIKSDPEHPGFKHIIMRPNPAGSLRSVKASYLSPHGRIVSEWHTEAGRFEWDIVVPANTTATLFVPAPEAGSVTEQGRPIARAAGIRVDGKSGDRVQLEVGAGTYHFQANGGSTPQGPRVTASP